MGLLSAILQEAEQMDIKVFKQRCDEICPRIKELTEKIQMLSWSLQENFVEMYVNYSAAKSLEQLNYRNRKGKLVTEYDTLIEEAKSVTGCAELDSEEINSYIVNMEKAYSLFKRLCVAVEGGVELNRAEREFRRRNTRDALLAVEALRKRLRELTLEGDAALALSGLRADTDARLAVYTASLSLEWGAMFSWSERKSLSYLTYSLYIHQSDTTHMRHLLKTLYSVERLNVELAQFSDFFVSKILDCVIRHNCDIFTDEHLNSIIFNIKIKLSEDSKPSFQTIFNNLTAVLQFIQSTMDTSFDDGQSFFGVLSQCMGKRFFSKLIADCVKNNLPSCSSSYQHYKDLMLELESFNNFLVEVKFVNHEESPLNEYMVDTDCVLYKNKCDKLLKEVRSIMQESLSHASVKVGSSEVGTVTVMDVTSVEQFQLDILNKPLFLPKCVVSQSVKHIMHLVKEHLQESVRLPPAYSAQLVQYIKDIAVMYQTLVPRKFKVNLESCPLDIALFFNNCFYLAHGLVGPPWCRTLPAAMADSLNTILVECIQDLRILGLDKLSQYLQNQKNIIVQALKPLDQATWDYETYQKFDTAVTTSVKVMSELKSTWLDVLPARMYEMSISSLVAALCQAILQSVLSNSERIEEEVVFMLATRIEELSEEMALLYQEVPIDLDTKISVWKKFTKMSCLLKSQLLEISGLWNNSKELPQVYTCEEVRQIIKMRFPDNSFRLKVLAEIQ